MTLLLVGLLATAYMAGLSWFVGVVHYPLFAGVPDEAFAAYHRRHSSRTATVVVAPMTLELAVAAWLVADRPPGIGPAAAIAGLTLAATAWALTARASRIHTRLGRRRDPAALASLLRVHHVRSLVWSAHAVLLALMVAALV